MSKITYENKQFLDENSDIPAINKVQDTDMNEIKQVVNENDDILAGLLQPLEYIELGLTADKKFDAEFNYYYLDNLDVINYQTGSLFEVGSIALSESSTSMAGVKIPAGINKIKVGGQATIANNNTTSSMFFVTFIYKVSAEGVATTVSRAQIPNILAGNYVTNTISPKTIDVAEGDIIGFRIYKSLASGTCTVRSASEQTFLTVEEVR